MSEDVKKDLLKAIHDAQNNNAQGTNGNVVFPNPKVLKHSLDGGVAFPEPVYRQDGKDEDTD